MSEEISQIQKTKEAVQKLLNFNVQEQISHEDQGSSFNLTKAILPTERVINLFAIIPVDKLDILPDNKLQLIETQANNLWAQLQQMVEYDPTTPPEGQNATDYRDRLINQVIDSYTKYFEQLFPIISFLSLQNLDFPQLETQAQRILKSVQDSADAAQERLNEKDDEASETLEAIKKSAAEVGVSKEAIHFSQAADKHSKDAKIWLERTLLAAGVLGLIGVLFLVMSYLPFFRPEDLFQAIQQVVAKLIIVGVSVTLLLVCVRNYSTNKHNEVVNRHRQHSLLTFQTLTKAATGLGQHDIVLANAAACIYSPQDTGFTKNQSNSGSSNSFDSLKMVGLVPRAIDTPPTS